MVTKKLILKFWPLVVLLILTTLITWPLFLPGYFSHHDDLQVMRIFEMRKCLADFQIPCRWVPDMGYGNGYPLFNYYNPFPYYIGGIFSFFLPLIISAKIIFFIPLILAPVAMYFFAKEIFGKLGGFFAGVLYMFAPYRALDTYVRGAVSESFAIAIIPLVAYFALKLIKDQSRKNLIFFSISLAAFLTSHTIMILFFLPLLILMIMFWFSMEGTKNIKWIVYGFVLSLGLSAFFIFPAYFEKDLVQIDNLARFDLDFRAHFVTLTQLFFDRSWGYGASFPGPSDSISFQIGWPHWILVLFPLPLLLILKRKDKKMLFFSVIISLIFVLSIFMTHNKSAFVWEAVGILRFAQFPWRFLAVTIFTTSLLGGCLVYCFKQSLGKIIVFILVITTVLLNWNYFRPQKFIFDLTDQKELTGQLWEIQQKASILDYLPVGAGEPIEPAPDEPIIREGKAEIKNFEKSSNSWKLDLDVISPAKVEIPVMDFPDWKVYEAGKEIQHANDNYVKRISLSLQPGMHLISGRLTNTPIRTASNTISFLSLITIFYLAFYKRSFQQLRCYKRSLKTKFSSKLSNFVYAKIRKFFK